MRELNLAVLKSMVVHYDRNIKMFMGYLVPETDATKRECNDRIYAKLADMVANRRYIAALVENGGIKDDNFKCFSDGYVGVDSMLYSATAGADTSWWG
jgi:hypothetical protein